MKREARDQRSEVRPRKLGRVRSGADERNLFLSRYLEVGKLPAPPVAVSWAGAVKYPWGMLANDRIGDCVIAAAAHLEMQWNWNAGRRFVPKVRDVIGAYSAITGYDPKDPDTDLGTSPLECLKYWAATGICGRKIGAYVRTHGSDALELKHSVNLFLGSFLAVALPAAAQRQNVWDVPPVQALTGDWEPWSWGGHMVEAVGYDARGLRVITWGKEQVMTWAFAAAYCDEAYAILSQDMLDGKGRSPLGFDLGRLNADLRRVQND